jgi:hypothetical protein
MSALSDLKIRGSSWKKYDTARLQISVGQPYHEGSDLVALVKWVSEHFKHTIVCLNDTLQRYNGPGAEEAGSAWMERNMNVVNMLSSAEIFRWDYWLNCPDYPALHAEVKDKYRNDLVFRKVIDDESMVFALRQKPNNMGAFFERSKAYLLEECAAFQIMFRTPAADIYPGSTLIPCQIFKEDEGKGFTRVELRHSRLEKKQTNYN